MMRDDALRSISATMRETRQMQVPLEIKSTDALGRFAGYASVFHVVDSQKDVVLPGAFLQTISGRAREVKLLWQHDTTQPVGMITRLFEDKRGLYMEGALFMEVARAREALALMRQGVVSGLSIGYSPKRFFRDAKSGHRMLSQVDLWEVSLVTFPSNHESRISVIKSDVAAQQLAQLDHAVKRWQSIVR
tara:strand:+ start:761 stop:1330 length:570 start_codon:yes stop_codon:yes gene_type:complete